MINFLAYTSPQKKFDAEHEDLVKIQIDNSLQLGWKPENITIATNFDFEYRGIKTIPVEEKDLSPFNIRNGKINAIYDLFKKGKIKKDEIYFLHDFDAFQLVPVTDAELNLTNFDIGLTPSGYTRKSKENTLGGGVFFFNHRAQDIITWVENFIYQNKSDEEFGFFALVNSGDLNIKNRYLLLNQSYNLGIYNIPQNLALAEKPVRIIHFHPHRESHISRFRNLIPDRLMSIFNNYGIK